MDGRSRSRWAAVLLAAVIAALAGAASARADTWTVSGTGDAGGTCLSTTCPTVRAALTAAETNAGPDEIRLPAGQYALAAGELKVNGEVRIAGSSARTTVITAAPSARVFNVSAQAKATIAHLTMRNGSGVVVGGNLLSAGELTLDHVRVTGGFADDRGSGVASEKGTLTIEHSLIDHNSTIPPGWSYGGLGGAVLVGASTKSAEISTSTIALNDGGIVGGIYVLQAPTTVRLSRVTIAGNRGQDSAGLRVLTPGSVTIAGSLIADNGGLDKTIPPPANCYAWTLKGSTAALTSRGGNVESAADCGFTENTDRQTVPFTTVLANAGGETDTVAIPAGSPAIDLGAACADETDQRDLPRYQGSGCDAGAFELDQVPDTTISTQWRTVNAPDGKVEFSSSEPGSRFECRLVGDTFDYFGAASCTSPLPLRLQAGRVAHTLTVTAIDATGHRDPTPAVMTFRYEPGAPNVTISGPQGFTRDPGPMFEFASSLPQTPLECRLDDLEELGRTFEPGPWKPCTSPLHYDDLPDGDYRFNVRGHDDAGNPGYVRSRLFTVDTADPDTSLGSGPSGAIATASPSFSFTASEAGATFDCRLDGPGAAVGTYAPCGSPRAYDRLADGSYQFLVRARDAAGNVDASPVRREFSVDTLAPVAPAITAPQGDTLQRSDALVVEGTSEPNATIVVLDNGIVLDTATAGLGGRWFVKLTGLRDGVHRLAARARDAAGNSSLAGSEVVVRVDTVAPAAPSITSPAGDLAQGSGTVVLAGTADTDATIAVLDDGREVATTSPNPAGLWSVTLTDLAEGEHSLRARASDAAGNTRDSARTVSVRIDRTAPEAPVIAAPLEDAIQRDATFTLSGTAEAGASVEVLEGAVSRGTIMAAPGGEWRLTVTGAAEGEHAYRARATDAAGNTGPLSAPRSVRVELQRDAPAAPAAAAPAAAPAPPASPLTPSYHRSVVLAPVRGRTLSKSPGGTFAALAGPQLAPLGTIVDARGGAVRVSSVATAGAAPRSVVASGGRFAVTQVGAVTLLRLTGCRGRLSADGGSGFATRSRDTTARAAGRARWLLTDDCRRVRVRVARGEVRVRQGHRTRTIRAGRR